MPIYKPSELHDFLSSLGISPKKGMSQNFLIDGNIIRKIVTTSEIGPDDVVLEIGPGPGSLSEALLGTGATVIAVEKDRTLANALERLKTPENRFEVFCDDILEFPIEKVLSPYLSGGKKAKVIANLPYHLTTPILVQLVAMNEIFSSLELMVQEEVARRFVGKPGTSDYSAFTVFLSLFSNPHYAFHVSRNCFFPKPNVDSAVVILDLKPPPANVDQVAFFKMTRTAFGQRRKMLRTSLKPLYSTEQVLEGLKAIGCGEQVRPENLSLQDFLNLFKFLQDHSG
jgi:16S rRNA (adenine1518-N6/adenine1519-N6)-dimethyltransferase